MGPQVLGSIIVESSPRNAWTRTQTGSKHSLDSNRMQSPQQMPFQLGWWPQSCKIVGTWGPKMVWGAEEEGIRGGGSFYEWWRRALDGGRVVARWHGRPRSWWRGLRPGGTTPSPAQYLLGLQQEQEDSPRDHNLQVEGKILK